MTCLRDAAGLWHVCALLWIYEKNHIKKTVTIHNILKETITKLYSQPTQYYIYIKKQNRQKQLRKKNTKKWKKEDDNFGRKKRSKKQKIKNGKKTMWGKLKLNFQPSKY